MTTTSKFTVSVFSCLIGTALLVSCNPPVANDYAYAHVLGNGTLDAANSKNVVGLDGGNGLYCFKLVFPPKNAVATLANDPTAPNQAVGFIKVAVPPTPTFTCANNQHPDAVVETGNEATVNGGTSAGGFAFYVYWSK
jgi:hypothetical protein